jgi:hypothetical protein
VIYRISNTYDGEEDGVSELYKGMQESLNKMRSKEERKVEDGEIELNGQNEKECFMN